MKLRNSLLLLLTATIWGVAFVAQSVGMQYVGPMTYVCSRSIIGGVVLLPVIAVLNRNSSIHSGETPQERRKGRKILLIGGACCGLILSIASTTQQIALLYNDNPEVVTLASRQGRIPDRVLHSDRAAARPAVWPQVRTQALVWCLAGAARPVFPVHGGRQLRFCQGRFDRTGVRAAVFYPHSGY